MVCCLIPAEDACFEKVLNTHHSSDTLCRDKALHVDSHCHFTACDMSLLVSHLGSAESCCLPSGLLWHGMGAKGKVHKDKALQKGTWGPLSMTS